MAKITGTATFLAACSTGASLSARSAAPGTAIAPWTKSCSMSIDEKRRAGPAKVHAIQSSSRSDPSPGGTRRPKSVHSPKGIVASRIARESWTP